MNKSVQALLKLAVTGAAFFYVFQQLDSGDILESLRALTIWHWLLAIILYLTSQWISAIRLNTYLESVRAKLPYTYNFLLYLIGMAYNFFLPGGIGGDGYKVVLLKKYKNLAPKQSIGVFLADRLIGLVGILIILAIILPLASQTLVVIPGWVGVPTALMGFLLSKWIFKMIWPVFRFVFNKTAVQSMIVQIFQIGCILVLCHGVSMKVPLTLIATLFLLSTIATAIPVFLGGLGAREMVFIWAGRTEGIAVQDPATLVSVAVLFSMVTLISALPGLVVDWKIKHEDYF